MRTGRPKGSKGKKTLEKEAARAFVRDYVIERLRPMLDAQVAHAQGISHFMLRDPKTGKFERITDVDQITAALNASDAKEGSSYYIWAKDPSVQAFTDLMNRALDKPAEQEQAIAVTGALDVFWRGRPPG